MCINKLYKIGRSLARGDVSRGSSDITARVDQRPPVGSVGVQRNRHQNYVHQVLNMDFTRMMDRVRVPVDDADTRFPSCGADTGSRPRPEKVSDGVHRRRRLRHGYAVVAVVLFDDTDEATERLPVGVAGAQVGLDVVLRVQRHGRRPVHLEAHAQRVAQQVQLGLQQFCFVLFVFFFLCPDGHDW